MLWKLRFHPLSSGEGGKNEIRSQSDKMHHLAGHASSREKKRKKKVKIR